MNRITKLKSIKLLKISTIVGYFSLSLLLLYFIYYINSCVLNFEQTFLNKEQVFPLMIFSLLIVSFVFGFFIPFITYGRINDHRNKLFDDRDNNRLVTAILYIKKGDLKRAVDISNTIKSPKRKSFLLGIINGFTFNSQYEEQIEIGLNELNKFKYK